jgi:hypothetical protein
MFLFLSNKKRTDFVDFSAEAFRLFDSISKENLFCATRRRCCCCGRCGRIFICWNAAQRARHVCVEQRGGCASQVSLQDRCRVSIVGSRVSVFAGWRIRLLVSVGAARFQSGSSRRTNNHRWWIEENSKAKKARNAQEEKKLKSLLSLQIAQETTKSKFCLPQIQWNEEVYFFALLKMADNFTLTQFILSEQSKVPHARGQLTTLLNAFEVASKV